MKDRTALDDMLCLKDVWKIVAAMRPVDAGTGRALYNMHMHWYVQGIEALMKALSRQVCLVDEFHV
jgi:hypothetical protein